MLCGMGSVKRTGAVAGQFVDGGLHAGIRSFGGGRDRTIAHCAARASLISDLSLSCACRVRPGAGLQTVFPWDFTIFWAGGEGVCVLVRVGERPPVSHLQNDGASHLSELKSAPSLASVSFHLPNNGITEEGLQRTPPLGLRSPRAWGMSSGEKGKGRQQWQCHRWGTDLATPGPVQPNDLRVGWSLAWQCTQPQPPPPIVGGRTARHVRAVRKVRCFSPLVATGPRVSPCWYTRDFLF